jgi:hypothetical protein
MIKWVACLLWNTLAFRHVSYFPRSEQCGVTVRRSVTLHFEPPTLNEEAHPLLDIECMKIGLIFYEEPKMRGASTVNKEMRGCLWG